MKSLTMEHAHDQAWQAMSGRTVWYNGSESLIASYQRFTQKKVTASQHHNYRDMLIGPLHHNGEYGWRGSALSTDQMEIGEGLGL